MSYDIHLIRFRDGDAGEMDAALFDQLIGPHVASRDPEHGFVRLKAEDGGEADVYANSETDPELMGVTVTHFSAGRVLDVIAELADRLGAAIVLQDGPTLISESARSVDLPAELRSNVEVVDFSGAAIEAAIARA